METYGVTGSELLFCGDDCSAALGGVEGSLSTDNGLTLAGTTSGLATDLGNGIPIVRHGE